MTLNLLGEYEATIDSKGRFLMPGSKKNSYLKEIVV